MNPRIRFAIELAALCAIGAGLWLLSPPAAVVTIGSLVLLSSVVGRIRGN